MGTPSEVYSTPASAYVASFLGNATLFRADGRVGVAGRVPLRVEDLSLPVAPAAGAAGVGDRDGRWCGPSG